MFRNMLMGNSFPEKIVPEKGSILYCDLYCFEHTGIYVGNNNIVELLGTGEIRVSTAEQFVEGTNASQIYVACNEEGPIARKHIADNAIMCGGLKRNYHLLRDNCHQFSAGCIIASFDNRIKTFLLLQMLIAKELNNFMPITWRAWDR